jgi:tyrosyl-DNA phosphodiesterase-1
MADDSEERARKRQRLNNDDDDIGSGASTLPSLPKTLTSSISPPPLRRGPKSDDGSTRVVTSHRPRSITSQFQLTWIRDLPASSNVDAITLKDILGDPLIAECWEFNYLHDIDFLMEAFDNDVRDLVKVHVIHGFWKQNDNQRERLKACLFV